MALQVLQSRSPASDPAALRVIEYLQTRQDELGLDQAWLYYGYPRFRDDDDELVRSHILLLSPQHGVVLIGFSSATDVSTTITATETVDARLFTKLLSSKPLRRSSRELRVQIHSAVFAPSLSSPVGSSETHIEILASTGQLVKFINSSREEPLDDHLFGELQSSIDGTKSIPRPKKRAPATSGAIRGRLVERLESQLALFDTKQREASLTDITGPQRIRGLAGSGKTIVLAKKAALLHIDDPRARIGYTFHTKSLYQQVKRLITRFYRDDDDRDPDWDRITVLHSWGGSDPGIYSQVCRAAGVRPLTFADAAREVGPSAALEYACKKLLSESTVPEMFDFFFVDEGQDFPPAFLQLCAAITKDEKFVYAYDDLQTIFRATAPTPAEIWGTNKDGKPNVQFERDIVLYKCYRNPRPTLVCAHAIGFGIYGDSFVQMLENEEHWRDIGYERVSGSFTTGSEVVLERPVEHSVPLMSDEQTVDELVSCEAFDSWQAEIEDVCTRIQKDIEEGLRPDDIVVVVVDDRYAKRYLQDISRSLAKRKVRAHNIHVAIGLVDFQSDDAVTLTTVHKAKGNEAYSVYVVGADAAFVSPDKSNRNKLFTAMTRAKAWLRVTGIGEPAQRLCTEIERAKSYVPALRFVYPDPSTIEFLKRDLDDRAVEDLALERQLDALSDEELRRYLERRGLNVPKGARRKGS